MFCDGVCKKKNKKCGLLTEVIMENKKDGIVRTEDHCVLQAILHSCLRSEGQRDGLHAAENSTRNEMAKGLGKIKETIGTSMIGILKTIENKERNFVRRLSNEPELIGITKKEN
jgi:hypothetical protein